MKNPFSDKGGDSHSGPKERNVGDLDVHVSHAGCNAAPSSGLGAMTGIEPDQE